MENIFKKVKQFVEKLFGKFESNHLLGLLGLIFVVLVVSNYSGQKGLTLDNFGNNDQAKEIANENTVAEQGEGTPSSSIPQPAQPLGTNEGPSIVSGIGSPASGLPPSCTRTQVTDPADLLPSDQNSAWAKLNPTGTGDLNNINLLKSGYHIGIDTIGNSLRNANLQVRSEPPNPQNPPGPWNQSTISPDLQRVPLEIGCGSQ
jgi:hypothetical protein